MIMFYILLLVIEVNNLQELVVNGGKLLATDDLNNQNLFKGAITIYIVSGDIPKNAPSGATEYGEVICIDYGRRTQFYIDNVFSLKSRLWYSNVISSWR